VKGAEIFDLSGRVAIVTGASIGLGQQMADALAEMGANVVLCGRKKERCEQAAAELEKCGVGTRGLACEVKDSNSIQAGAANVPYFTGPNGITPTCPTAPVVENICGSPGAVVPSFTPDLKKIENRINLSILVKF
jgi:NAD(P)-dependent dehydrogenase (short-subunit alcohol dehydrogenase family)